MLLLTLLAVSDIWLKLLLPDNVIYFKVYISVFSSNDTRVYEAMSYCYIITTCKLVCNANIIFEITIVTNKMSKDTRDLRLQIFHRYPAL